MGDNLNQGSEAVRTCEGCESPLHADLCARFDFIKPHWLCVRCQRLLGAVRLGTFASDPQRDGQENGPRPEPEAVATIGADRTSEPQEDQLTAQRVGQADG